MATQREGLTQEGEGTTVGAGFILPGKKMGRTNAKNKENKRRGAGGEKKEVLIVPELLTFPKVSVQREAHLRFLPFFCFWRLCFVCFLAAFAVRVCVVAFLQVQVFFHCCNTLVSHCHYNFPLAYLLRFFFSLFFSS
jgi:hypothetical protein